MSSIEVIENKISSIREYLGILRGYAPRTFEEIIQDVTLRGAIERYLYLAAQATIDLAEAVVALKRYRKPTTMSESFDILCDEQIIAREIAGRMVQLAGFRNVIAHEYTKVNYDIVYDVLHNRLADIERFVKAVQEKI